MKTKLLTQQVGPYQMNTYLIVDGETGLSAVIDPGGDADKILKMASGTQVAKILITHGHSDHVLALEEIKAASGAPVFIHPADADEYQVNHDHPLEAGSQIRVGKQAIQVIHIPGHTPGQCCLDLGDGRIVVGDTLFVGGPGRTATPQDFTTTMRSMQEIVFTWPDNTSFFPGHGPSGSIGLERPAFEAFVARGWPEDTHGDVTWA